MAASTAEGCIFNKIVIWPFTKHVVARTGKDITEPGLRNNEGELSYCKESTYQGRLARSTCGNRANSLDVDKVTPSNRPLLMNK